VVVTQDDRVLTGVVAGQTPDTLLLRDSSGAEVRVRRDQIADMKRQASSLMPEGLERTLTEVELRDLLAFLQSLR
jgi:putative heme-binding domain-containing protein